MNEFLWESGHLGWGIFAVAIFTGLWILLADLYWRLKTTRMLSLLCRATAGWAFGIALIVLGVWLSNR